MAAPLFQFFCQGLCELNFDRDVFCSMPGALPSHEPLSNNFYFTDATICMTTESKNVFVYSVAAALIYDRVSTSVEKDKGGKCGGSRAGVKNTGSCVYLRI